MEESLICTEMKAPDASQLCDTIQEVPDVSVDTEKFISVEESQTAVTFDVSSSMETAVDDKSQCTSEIKCLIDEEFTDLEVAEAFDDRAMLETPAVPLKESELEFEIQLETPKLDAERVDVDEKSFFQDNVLELGRCLWPTDTNRQCYTKGCLWSPDGTCCLVPVHLDGMHLFELPADLYKEEIAPNRPLTKLSTAVHVKEGGTVYDCAWYPFMNSTIPETCCWIASRQHEPIQMWDAFTGDLRATYRGYDDVDEIEAAISVIFSCDGQQVLGGYKKYIRIFHTEIPGRNSTKLVTKQAISSFALTPTQNDVITTGSWNGVINLYDKRVLNVGSLNTFLGHTGGITFLKYSNNGELLLSGARKENSLCLWDMRNFSKPVTVLDRTVSTNQRIYFDLSPQNEWLISGDTTGLIKIWNLRNILQTRTFRLHGDSCNGVSFHPTKPIIATSAGQYHFIDPVVGGDSEEIVVDYENSLVFWWIESRI